jgi:hypothetical protein
VPGIEEIAGSRRMSIELCLTLTLRSQRNPINSGTWADQIQGLASPSERDSVLIYR